MADSPMRLKTSILASLELIRTASSDRMGRMEDTLRGVGAAGRGPRSTLLCMWRRIEASVLHAVNTAAPEMIHIVSRYTDRMGEPAAPERRTSRGRTGHPGNAARRASTHG